MKHRLGPVVLSHVRMSCRSNEDDGTRVTWYFDDDVPEVPRVHVPCVLDVVVDGQELGVRSICCSGRGTSPGSKHLSVKWRGD